MGTELSVNTIENLIDVSELTEKEIEEFLQQLDQDEVDSFDPVDLTELSDDTKENLIDVSELTEEEIEEVPIEVCGKVEEESCVDDSSEHCTLVKIKVAK